MARRTLPLRLTSMDSISGLWTGQTRSTPSPKLILRTVKFSFRPPPERAMQTPSKRWTRWRSPSRIHTFTVSVSPGENSGIFLSPSTRTASSCSSCWIRFMALLLDAADISSRDRVGAVALCVRPVPYATGRSGHDRLTAKRPGFRALPIHAVACSGGIRADHPQNSRLRCSRACRERRGSAAHRPR
ncbi:hypothetical protein OA2633_09419 [Oceanicaulis sp. HTCC2633]|nr:hypothetical protein OA2633_09419 [Oceanicaulis sp. HTCC2633]